MKKLSKILSLIICITLVLSPFTYTRPYAATNPPSDPELPQDEVDRIIAKLTADGIDLTNIYGEYLNAGVYKKYGIAVYGFPHEHDIGRDKKWVNGHYEYRYLGHDYNGNNITNDRFPADFPPDNAPLPDRIWQAVDKDLDSWRSNVAHGDQRLRILNYNPIYNDGIPYNYSLSQVVQKQAGTDTVNQQRHMLVQVAPGLISDGSVRLTRKVADGSLRYMTFILDRFNYGSPTCSINASNAVMEEDRDYVDIPVTVIGDFSSMELPMGKTASDIINEVTLTFEGSARGVTVSNPTATFTKRIYRKDLNVGNNTVNLEGILDAGSVYRLQGDSCEYQGIRATKTITVEVKSTNAYVEIEARAIPEKKQVDGSTDQRVTVNVTAKLKNYNNRSNVKSWRIFAKMVNEESSLQLKTLSGETLIATTSFTFTVNRSKLSSMEYTELFKVTGFADFNSKVDSNEWLNNSAYTKTHFYKVPPPPPPPPEPGNIPPVAVITAPILAVAGDFVRISGGSSYDPDGTIEGHEWILTGTLGNIEGVTGEVVYPNPGNYPIELYVIDNRGASDNTLKYIRVIEPYPSASITHNGILKENRKVTLDSAKSYSPPLYPIDSSKTIWTITPLSGGTASDIKYEGSLVGAAKKEVLFKKEGEYLVTLTVTNTKGLSDTTQCTIIIAQDDPPIADFTTVTAITRNVNDSLQATIKLADKSYSPDADIIVSRTWRYAFDSNNDGNFDDETWITFNTGNNKNVEFKANSVGRYKIELEVKEEFNGVTIPALISDSDYKRGNTEFKPASETIVEVINLPPDVDYIMAEKKKVDLNICVGDTVHSDIDVLNSKVESIIKPEMAAQGIDLNVNILGQEGDSNNLFWYTGHRTFWAYSEWNEDYYECTVWCLAYYDPSTGNHVIVEEEIPTYTQVKITSEGKVFYNIGSMLYEYDPVTNTKVMHSYISPYDVFIVSCDGEWVYWTSSYYYRDPYFDYELEGTYINTYNIITKETSSELFMSLQIALEKALYDGRVVIRQRRFDEYFFSRSIFDPKTGERKPTASLMFGDYFTYNKGDRVYARDTFNDSTLYSWNLDGSGGKVVDYSVINIIGARDEDLIFYEKYDNGNYYVYRYVEGEGAAIILEGGWVPYAVTYDNKIYYSKKTDLKKIYTYDIEKNSHEYIGEFPLIGGYGFDIRELGVTYSYDPVSNKDCTIANRLINADWREDADKYFVHIDDKELEELNDGNVSAAIQYDLISNNLHFIGMGTIANQSQINKLITQNGGNGAYINNSSLDTAFDNLRNYIVGQSSVHNDLYGYVTVGTEVKIDTFYSDPENDPKYQTRWKYIHDPSYFENSNGIIPDSGVDRTEPITVFDKVGKYEVQCQVRDNPKDDVRFENYRLWSSADKKMTLYVHRKPVAQFNYEMEYNSSLNNYRITITDTSYDLDHMDRPDKGIVERKWQYKEADDEAWIEGMPPSTLPADKVYMVKLQVRDMEFEWSDPYIQVLETKIAELPPIAQFVLWPNPLPIYMMANITDNSYDPGGNSITSRVWTLFKKESQENGIQLYTGSTAPVNYNLYGTGDYTLKLKVQNSKGIWSDEYSQDFRVVNDEITPILTIDPMKREWENTNVTVNIQSRDEGSGLKTIYYRWTNSQDKPNSTGWSSSTSSNFNVTQTQNGIWYLHVESYDNRNNKIYLVGGPYKIDKTPPMINASPELGDLSDTDEVLVTAYDEGGSGLKEVWYCWTDSTQTPSSGWSVTLNTAFYTAPSSDGIWHLHMQAFDNAGNSFYKQTGPYDVGSLAISKVMIEGYWNHWRGQVDIFGKRMTEEPHRFLSLERVKINIYTEGYADKVEIRFSPDLEAMQFMDRYGNLYDHKEDFNLDYVYFPNIINLDNSKKENHVYWEYTLPLANSTKSWEDTDLREPYIMEVTVWKGTKSVKRVISDIDVTGNIYDLTYTQPIN